MMPRDYSLWPREIALDVYTPERPGLFEFTWARVTKGWQWIYAKAVRSNGNLPDLLGQQDSRQLLSEIGVHNSADLVGWYLVPVSEEPTAAPAKTRYRPDEEDRNLFARFAELPPSREAIQEFANCWGNLGQCGVAIREVSKSGRTQGPVRFGEFEHFWTFNIKTIGRAFRKWNLIRTGQWDLVTEILWEENFEDMVLTLPASRDIDEFLESVPRSEEEFLEIYSDQHVLEDAAWSGLLWEVNNRMVHTSPKLIRDEDATSSALRIESLNLATHFWVQFANAINDNKEFHRCQSCCSWFEKSPGTGRSDKRYCSDACRMKAYRKRKAARLS